MKWKIGDRVLHKNEKKGFLGTIVRIQNEKIGILLDNGNKVLCFSNDDKLLGKGVKKKYSKPIPITKIKNYLKVIKVKRIPKLAPPAADVAKRIIGKYGDRLHDKAICLITPVPELLPLSEVAPKSERLRKFLTKYEPRVATSGLYKHQAKVVTAVQLKRIPNIIMTTATGSGKSLAFWAWAFEILARDENATVIATFPTQALLWGQAHRLADMSKNKVQYGVNDEELNDVFFAGSIKVGDCDIPWSVWYGTFECDIMKQHEKTDAFSRARIRVCTLDKVHWSLMQKKDSDFLSHLSGIIIDEAHSWHGLSGANDRAMIDRLLLSMDVLKEPHPSFFLASATLPKASNFAMTLTGKKEFMEINDTGAAKASLVDASCVPKLLSQTAEHGLLRRYVFLLKPEPKPLVARNVLDIEILGNNANALCFVQSRFVGHLLGKNLIQELMNTDVVVYDADLPVRKRRKLEKELFNDGGKQKVVVGTSALELGVDLPTLDLVVMDDLPPRRCELLQRLGRVGRSSERPGLAVLCLGYSPGDVRLIEEPLKAVAVDDIRPIPLPLHLEIVRLRAMRAAFSEWIHRLKYKEASWKDFNDALEKYFEWAPSYQELNEHLEKVIGDIVDLDEKNWYYKGFRVSASQGKRKMKLDNEKKTIVAMIEDTAIFRDAHPEGIYLGHSGDSYRIKQYIGEWDVATWTSPKGIVLGKYMKGLKHIVVSRENSNLVTRGRWVDRFILGEAKRLVEGHDCPEKGKLTFGVFRFIRKFNGYKEIDLSGRSEERIVSLQEVATRFSEAVKDGNKFPFLSNFSYQTKGWMWIVSRVLDIDTRMKLSPILGPLLHGFFCDAVECAKNDLQVTLDAQAGELRVVDSTPGGNGLCEALLTDDRVTSAWKTAISQVSAQGKKPKESFHRYIAEECRIDSKISAKEVIGAIKLMESAWNG